MTAKEHDGSGAPKPLEVSVYLSDWGTIAVTATLVDGRIRDFGFTPSFGTFPRRDDDGVLMNLASALDGLPADLELPALAARIRAAIPFGFGTFVYPPRLLAVAIASLAGMPDPIPRIGSLTAGQIDALTARWKHYDWRIVPESPLPAATNVAIDEVLSDAGRPSLRFWRWAEPAVVLGRCQSIANEVDRAALDADGIRIVRRFSGGGTMFVQPHGAITYSLVLPEDAVAGLTIRRSYEVCDAWVVLALRELGADAHHVPVNDIACAEGKIGGAAQARRRGVVLHHATLAYDLSMDELIRYLRIGRERPNANAVVSAAKVVSPLVAQVRHSRDAIVERLAKAFQSNYGGSIEPLAAEELASAEELVRTKYAHPDWTDAFP